MRKPARISYLIRRAQLLTYTNLTDCLRGYNLTPMQYTLLSLSRRGGEMSSAELARKFATSPQSMNETIATLEQKHLIARSVAGKNRRTLQISLTLQGARLLKACDREVDRMEKLLFSSLSSAEIHSLRTVLIKFTNSPGGVRTVAGSRNRMVSAGATRPN